ncbi:hypothetical protein GUJ93_ZPchr0009g1830 [Zizania palustris]|uniref:Uncharacterized protein n=1 Tax=Zizania palustris TaxID=103762 RepID=A0A8J5R179_ZIZPA|nr:hypothetical protein GUJ93_ZPchr0009g1830 [Zizania palustris]
MVLLFAGLQPAYGKRQGMAVRQEVCDGTERWVAGGSDGAAVALGSRCGGWGTGASRAAVQSQEEGGNKGVRWRGEGSGGEVAWWRLRELLVGERKWQLGEKRNEPGEAGFYRGREEARVRRC